MVDKETMSAIGVNIAEKLKSNGVPTSFICFSNGEDVVVCAHGSLADIVDMTTQALNNTILDSPTGQTLSGTRVKMDGLPVKGDNNNARGH